MSLKQQLADSQSPIARWMERTFSREGISLLVHEINDRLARITPIRHGGNAIQVGRAVDYGVRWSVGPLGTTVAQRGAQICRDQYGWALAEQTLATVLAAGESGDLRERARCCLALSWFEGVFRGDKPDAGLAQALDAASVAQARRLLLINHRDADVDDVAAILETVPAVWGDELHGAVMNPSFSGSALVGGADADWISGDTLWECKTSRTARPMERRHLLQALGYALLDFDDAYGIRAVGWYFARHRLRLRYPLDTLLYRLLDDTDQTLEELRADLHTLLNEQLSHVRITTYTQKRDAMVALREALTHAWPEFAEREADGAAAVRACLCPDLTRLTAPTGDVTVGAAWCVLVGVIAGRHWVPLLALVEDGAVRWTRPTAAKLNETGALPVAALPAERPIDAPFWQHYAAAVREMLAGEPYNRPMD